jgi:lipoate-protein ligase A
VLPFLETLTSEEENLLRKQPYFSSQSIFSKLGSPPRRKTLSSSEDMEGIRISIALDTKTQVINQILITGDFFASPKRAIFDLESLLKNSKASSPGVERIVRSFFADRKPEIPGVKEAHLIQAIEEALQKNDLLSNGFDEGNASSLPVQNLQRDKEPEVLLLPTLYQRWAAFTEEEGFENVVNAPSVMLRRYLIAIVDVRFSAGLESTLEQLKRSGVRGFIGSCCEPFYGKHRPDFERIGLPGILIDVERSTCYDLGQERKAFKGQFENQTHLNLPLLRKVLEYAHG